jgi:hypothetical protein
MRTASRVLALAGACAMTAAALQGTAVAASPDVTSRVAASIDLSALRASVAPNVDSTFLGGYAAALDGNQKTVSTITVLKTGTCGAADKAALSNAYSFNTALSGAFAFSGCIDGEPFAFLRLQGTDGSALDVDEVTEPGDKIKVTITDGANGKVAVNNTTQGWTANITSPSQDPIEYQVGVGRVLISGVEAPMQKFGTAPFKANTVEGQPMGATGPVKVQLVNAGGQRLATASNLSNGGKDFTVKWVKAS